MLRVEKVAKVARFFSQLSLKVARISSKTAKKKNRKNNGVVVD